MWSDCLAGGPFENVVGEQDEYMPADRPHGGMWLHRPSVTIGHRVTARSNQGKPALLVKEDTATRGRPHAQARYSGK